MRKLTRWAVPVAAAMTLAAPVALLAQSGESTDPSSPPSAAPSLESSPSLELRGSNDGDAPGWIASPAGDSQSALAELERSLALSEERRNQLRAEIESMK